MMKVASFAALALSLSACISVLPEPETADGLYRFGPIERVSTLTASVVIREPDASRLFAGRAMAAEGTDGALRLVRGVEWTDNATRLMQTGLIDALGGEGSSVALASDTGVVTDYELIWRLNDFTLAGETARCRVEATLLKGKTRDVLAQIDIAEDARAENDSNAARARALAEAGRTCVQSVAAFVAAETNAR